MKRQPKPAIKDPKDYVWWDFGPCRYCHEKLQVEAVAHDQVVMRHVRSGLSYESCRKQRREQA